MAGGEILGWRHQYSILAVYIETARRSAARQKKTACGLRRKLTRLSKASNESHLWKPKRCERRWLKGLRRNQAAASESWRKSAAWLAEEAVRQTGGGSKPYNGNRCLLAYKSNRIPAAKAAEHLNRDRTAAGVIAA